MILEEISPALPDRQRKRYFLILQIIHILAWVIVLLPPLTEFAAASYFAGTEGWFGNGRAGFGTTFWRCIGMVGTACAMTGTCYIPCVLCCIGALLLKRGARISVMGAYPRCTRFRIMAALSLLCLAGEAYFLLPIARIGVYLYQTYLQYYG